MSEKKILVIDDSATIRKLVDTHLSSEGYTVILAANAEDGLAFAEETLPDLIILDHQLPGTTGYEVCQKLLASPTLKQIPVVASSTLRKKAYVEYTDCDNVVDMLPKPYTEELLKTTVANALETAAMIVASQSQGTAVPEVIHQTEEASLAGAFTYFSLRELLDFLNNGGKSGTLEVEADRLRLWFYLDRGRIQGASATGITAEEVERLVSFLPQSLTNLSAVLKLTIGGRGTAEVQGIVQLLDQKVLDPRLTAKLLRFQACMLVRLAFGKTLKAFRFHAGKPVPALHRELPIDCSLLALLVEQAIYGDGCEIPTLDERVTFVRRSIRGQNLDRTGLAARHMKILNLLSEPQTIGDLTAKLGWEEDEVRRVLHGFTLAELVEPGELRAEGQVVVFEPDPAASRQAKLVLGETIAGHAVKVVRDSLAFQLLLKRASPAAVAFAADDPRLLAGLRTALENSGATGIPSIAIVDAGGPPVPIQEHLGFEPRLLLERPYSADSFADAVTQVLHPASAAAESGGHALAAAGVGSLEGGVAYSEVIGQ